MQATTLERLQQTCKKVIGPTKATGWISWANGYEKSWSNILATTLSCPSFMYKSFRRNSGWAALESHHLPAYSWWEKQLTYNTKNIWGYVKLIIPRANTSTNKVCCAFFLKVSMVILPSLQFNCRPTHHTALSQTKQLYSSDPQLMRLRNDYKTPQLPMHCNLQ